jgi:ribonuclease P protein subunit POP4
MVPITASNIRQHELIGLPVSVTCSSNPSQVGISGLLVDESMKTVTISNDAKDRVIQKKGTSFCLTLRDGSTVTVEGRSIFGRHVERVKGKIGGS